MIHKVHDVFVTSDSGVALTKFKMVNMFDFNRSPY